MKFYENIAAQAAVIGLFLIAMLLNFRLTHFSLLGAYVLSYAFCALWGNIGYLVFSDALFALLTPWISGVGNFSDSVDICFMYLLFTFIPGILIVHIRNELLRGAFCR